MILVKAKVKTMSSDTRQLHNVSMHHFMSTEGNEKISLSERSLHLHADVPYSLVVV